MKAIISDIHGNLEALQAVLADAERHGAEDIYCLGDLVGYGPNPRECVDLAMAWKVVLLGNHDYWAVQHYPVCLGSAIAERSIVWTRAQMAGPGDPCWEFLTERPQSHREDGVLFVHGSARNPLYDYVFPEDIFNQPKMERIFALVERYCFQGHTHIPGVFTEDLTFHSPEEVGGVYRLDGGKTMVNVGSVGQPRDGDWRACYVLLKEDVVCFRRVEYDVGATAKKIRDSDDLDDFSGDRLGGGR
jgi:diadenosine tetraphosphatase ApaH/serine/threonine PP2A family protein phosphatase